jgi:hypothetical protein
LAKRVGAPRNSDRRPTMLLNVAETPQQELNTVNSLVTAATRQGEEWGLIDNTGPSFKRGYNQQWIKTRG